MKRPSVGSGSGAQSQPSSGNGIYINSNNNNNNSNIPPVSGNVLFNSYQKDGSHSNNNNNNAYQPPLFYAKDQTTLLDDTTKVYYETDETASKVLSSLVSQRQQIQQATNTVTDMQYTTQLAAAEIDMLRTKYKAKKRQLYIYIAILSIVDVLLFVRMIHCHGNFYCW